MRTLDLELDVYQELTLRLEPSDQSYNDVLRRLLKANAPAPITVSDAVLPSATVSTGGWYAKGVTFPEGTFFRASYNGKIYNGKVQNGALVVEGQPNPFTSPSPAAHAITGTSLNGWLFWQCKFPGTSNWVTINTLRS